MSIHHDCRVGNRCNRWRDCDRCARIRQAHIADVAENRLARNHYLTYVVVTTREPITLETDRERLLRSVRRISSGGVWTVEAGEKFGGLHVNLMIASERPITEHALKRVWGDLGNIHMEPVYGWREYWRELSKELDQGRYEKKPGDLIAMYDSERLDHMNKTATESCRSVAAYIAKRAGMPSQEEYGGRIYGSWGSAYGKPKSVDDVLTSEGMQNKAPHIALATISSQLEAMGFSGTGGRSGMLSATDVARRALDKGSAEDLVMIPGQGIAKVLDVTDGVMTVECKGRMARYMVPKPLPKRPPPPPKPPKHMTEEDLSERHSPAEWMAMIKAKVGI